MTCEHCDICTKKTNGGFYMFYVGKEIHVGGKPPEQGTYVLLCVHCFNELWKHNKYKDTIETRLKGGSE